MTDGSHGGAGVRPQKEDPETLVLRGKPRQAIRFRRGLVIGAFAVFSAGLIGLSWMSLEPRSFRSAMLPDEGSEGRGKPPDALTGLPSGYGDVPRLGPPLPGDLGRPILEHRREAEADASEPHGMLQGSVSDETQGLRDPANEARRSAILVGLAVNQDDRKVDVPATPAPPASSISPEPERANSAMLGRSAAGYPGTVIPASSPYLLQAGSVIPASLITGLNSDVPGLVVAQVTEDVRDSVTGRFVLVPQGARLIGRYDSSISYGATRAFVIWDRVLFPDGTSLDLPKTPATEPGGEAGIADRVDRHGWQVLKGALLSTLLGLGNAAGPSGEGEIARAIRQSAQQNGTAAGEQVVERGLSVKPTIMVRPGARIRALVNEDLQLQPWKG